MRSKQSEARFVLLIEVEKPLSRLALKNRARLSRPLNRTASAPRRQKNYRAVDFPRQNRSLVAIGGGKDSIVNLEHQKLQTTPFSGFVVESNRSYAVIDQIGRASCRERV